MNKTDELKALAKGFMAQKKELKAKDEEIKKLNNIKKMMDDLIISGNKSSTDIDTFMSTVNDKVNKIEKELAEMTKERDVLQKSVNSLNIELSKANEKIHKLEDELNYASIENEALQTSINSLSMELNSKVSEDNTSNMIDITDDMYE